MTTDSDTLLSMGFDPARVEWALKATGNRGLQPAMDHILENEGKPVPDLSSVSAASSSAPSGGGAGGGDDDDEDADALRAIIAKSEGDAGAGGAESQEARSIKCSECGKIFRNTAMANFHAEKSGHDQFEESTEEIKPLTEEEKKQKLAELRAKMAEKKARKAEEDAKEAKANEAIRRKGGQDMTQIREELKAKEAIKEAAQRKKDKIDDARARAAVKAQIEADKKARAEKAAREKALRDGTQLPPQPIAQTSAPAASGSSSGPKEHKDTRLQIRLASGGQPYTTTLPSDSTLEAVAEFLAAQTLQVSVDTVTFACHFPRKTFTRADWSKTLKELGLTPSAVLIAS